MRELSMLIDPKMQKKIEGMKVPEELYWILDDPAPLAGMSYPKSYTPWSTLFDLGFTNLISLETITINPEPLKIIFRDKLEDLASGGPACKPEDEATKIIRAVSSAKSKLIKGKGVLIHCCGGRGRTGTVIGCILR